MKVTVRQMVEHRSRQWGIYIDNQLVEGGFFYRSAAEDAAAVYRQQFTGGN
jgi:hypothetical protein